MFFKLSLYRQVNWSSTTPILKPLPWSRQPCVMILITEEPTIFIRWSRSSCCIINAIYFGICWFRIDFILNSTGCLPPKKVEWFFVHIRKTTCVPLNIDRDSCASSQWQFKGFLPVGFNDRQTELKKLQTINSYFLSSKLVNHFRNVWFPSCVSTRFSSVQK